MSASALLVPLTADEIRRAAATVRQHLSSLAGRDGSSEPPVRFCAIALWEGDRSSSKASSPASRCAEVITLDPSSGIASVHLVSTLEEEEDNSPTILSSQALPAGVQPMLTPDDCDLAESIVQSCPEVLQELKERYGIDDPRRVACDPWSVHLASEDDQALVDAATKSNGNVPARLVQTFLYLRQYGDVESYQDNEYACPLDMLPVVDLNARDVVHIHGLHRNPPPPLPKASVNYHRDLLKSNTYLPQVWRSDVLKALHVVQPNGPSFRVDSSTNQVEWQNWSFQVGFNYREGLVLHNVSFQGRSVLKRASLVEMAVPYGDPYTPHPRKCAFDVGDYGLGYCANSLQLGCDCLGHIHYFDAVLCNAQGEPVLKKNAVCLHEEDQGVLWKHVEYRNGHNESRRARELVVSSIATVVNYEYLFYWRFKLDGTIDCDIKLSGELSTNLVSEDEDPTNPTHGVLVAPGVNAQVHQHMFCARLDVAIDGLDNVVAEVDVVRAPLDPKSNPCGNVFAAQQTILESEQAAIRTADMTTARSWKILSASHTNPVNGKATAYKLVPFTKGPAQPTLLVDPSSAVAQKGAFATANLWVTPYRQDERFPAGEHTPQGDGSPGLPQWTAANRSLTNCPEGLVVWHAFGVCHVPRAEDFPVMPCEVTGFSLKPDNFFSGNPAIDLPPDDTASGSTLAGRTNGGTCCH